MTRPAKLVWWDGSEKRDARPVYWNGNVTRPARPVRHSTDYVPPPPTPSTGALIGAYMGNYGEYPDIRFEQLFGQPADILTTYYGPSGGDGQLRVAAEAARMANGTIPFPTVTLASGSMTHAQVAAGQHDAWIDMWASAFASLPDGEIWFSFDHEFEVKRNQNKFSWSPTDQDYASAYVRFVSRCKTARVAAGKMPLKDCYWWGYSRTSEINNIGALISAQAPPDLLAFDPYVFAHHSSSTTFEQMADTHTPGAKLSWTKTRPWYNGQPVGLAEFGMDAGHGQANCAAFLTNLRTRMDDIGLSFAVYFSRDKTGTQPLGIQADLTPAVSMPASGIWPGVNRSSSFSKGNGSQSQWLSVVDAMRQSVQSGGPNAA